MPLWAKYGTQTTFQFPMIKRGVVDFAQSGDWTPASTDAAVSKDNGNYADTTNTVAIVGGTPTHGVSIWKLTLTATELTAGTVTVQIVDAATKAVEDQSFTVYTYGNASAYFAGDWSDIVRLGLTALPNVASGSAGAIITSGTGTAQLSVTGGTAKADAVKVNADATAAANLATAWSTLETGTAQGGGANTITLRNAAESTHDDFYKDQAIAILSNTGAGQTNRITAYTAGTRVATVETAWKTQPDNTSVYLVLGRIG